MENQPDQQTFTPSLPYNVFHANKLWSIQGSRPLNETVLRAIFQAMRLRDTQAIRPWTRLSSMQSGYLTLKDSFMPDAWSAWSHGILVIASPMLNYIWILFISRSSSQQQDASINICFWFQITISINQPYILENIWIVALRLCIHLNHADACHRLANWATIMMLASEIILAQPREDLNGPSRVNIQATVT